MEFALGMAGWNESGAAPRRAHAAAAQAKGPSDTETRTAELAPGISASVCMTQEYATGKASGPRRAAATKTLTAGTYTIIAYQGTAEQHTENERKHQYRQPPAQPYGHALAFFIPALFKLFDPVCFLRSAGMLVFFVIFHDFKKIRTTQCA